METKNLRKANFKTKKELYEILKTNDCFVKRKLNVEKDTVDKFLQYSNDFDKYFNFFKDFVLKYTGQEEIKEVKSFIENNEYELIFRLVKRIYRKIDYINNNSNLVNIKNKSQYLILNNKQHFYKNDFYIKDNKIFSKDNLVTYEIYINDFPF